MQVAWPCVGLSICYTALSKLTKGHTVSSATSHEKTGVMYMYMYIRTYMYKQVFMVCKMQKNRTVNQRGKC